MEIWVFREGVVIRPVVRHDGDLVLIRREVPVFEINSDNTFSYFTEVWELKDGELQITSREVFFYDDQH